MNLREIRNKCNMTQKDASIYLNIPLRTYSRYENEIELINSMKYNMMCDMLSKKCLVDEEHGIVSIDDIKKLTSAIFEKYNLSYAYLFGSYAKGKQTEVSDIDIMISPSIAGLKYYGLLQELMDTLHKKIDLINISEAMKNETLLNEILKYGVKIYE